MKDRFDPSSRRSGLAAAAALAFGALYRPSAAAAQADSPSLMCCGNGPPDPRRGFGIQFQLTSSAILDRSFEFTNQVTGEENKKNWWVFAVGDGIVVVSYRKVVGGGSGQLLSFPVSTPAGPATAYRVQSGFLLSLIWPASTTPIFYTRQFASNE
jgi:hypothetical protein